MNNFQTSLLEMLKSDTKVIAMLAPSFPIDFPHPQIVGMLKKLGFEKVTELTFGARMTNYYYKQHIEKNPSQRFFIASPCPIVVNFVKKMYPELVEYMMPYASPMYAMAKIVRKQYPEYKIVFVSPCQAKRILEVPKYPGAIDLVITFKELGEIFENQAIKPEDFRDTDHAFDSFITERTKVYPISGGLAQTSHVQKIFKKEEICVADEIKNIKPILDNIKNGKSPFRFIDILNCPGGCVGGPDIKNRDLPLEEKDKIILTYRDRSIINYDDGKEGSSEYVADLDFHADL